MDLADFAQEAIEQLDALTIKRRPHHAGPQATGFCLFCGEPLADGRRWCGPECRDDWEVRDQRSGIRDQPQNRKENPNDCHSIPKPAAWF